VSDLRALSGLRIAGVFVVILMLSGCSRSSDPNPEVPPDDPPVEIAEAGAAGVKQFCGACHAYPPPDTFPRSAWGFEVMQGYHFYETSNYDNPKLRSLTNVPPVAAVIQYFENRAPEELPPIPKEQSSLPAPIRFERHDSTYAPKSTSPAVSNVNLVHLSDSKKLDLLVCDMRAGQVWLTKPYEQKLHWQLLGKVSNPAHAEVVDLDQDGIKDIIVANLGNLTPTNDKVGSVVWLRGLPDGTYQPVTLLEGVGRVADVQAADFRGSGKLDLIIAVFGWQSTGEIIYLENQTTDWKHPRFIPHVLDDRHGAIHVPVCDLNNDGKPDFVALISQEHETIVAFLNEGNGQFRKETIYTAPHPAYGSSGIQMVDLNGDGKLDVLYSNGDILDEPFLFKPYHGIQWLENKGTFPFVHHPLAPMYGAMRAVAADLTGTGKMDIVAVSFLPEDRFPRRKELQTDSVILLEQTAPGTFVRHSLETVTCDHVTCDLGAWDGDGKIHMVTGNFSFTDKDSIPNAITLWRNLGRK
jgi:hypothetical protein